MVSRASRLKGHQRLRCGPPVPVSGQDELYEERFPVSKGFTANRSWPDICNCEPGHIRQPASAQELTSGYGSKIQKNTDANEPRGSHAINS